jgi:hypothetical protein
MRVTFMIEGGLAAFPGLSKPITIDSAQLPKEAASRLEQLLAAVHFFDLPPAPGEPAPGAADYRQYTITVQAGKRRNTMRLTDPVTSADAQALVDFLESRARELRSAARGRAGEDGGGAA